MRRFSSWRLSRLLDISAWKRLIHHQMWILALIFCVTLWLCSYGSMPEDLERFQVIFWMSFIFFLYAFMDTILGADKHRQIRLKTTYCTIYVYNRNGRNSVWQDVIFIQDDTEAHIATKSTILKEQGCYFYKDAFQYCVDGDNNKWYYLSKDSDEPQFLGKKISYGKCTVFLGDQKNDGTLDLCILHNQKVLHLSADSFVYGNIYVPPMARKNIMYRYIAKQTLRITVDEYLIVKKNGKYHVYGLKCYFSEIPTCIELNVPAVIFQEVKDRVILVYNGSDYKELYRNLSATRWIDNVIAELSDKYSDAGGVGGVVWKFDEETKQLEKIYEGRYRALGFSDGSIVGDGWEYTPDPDEGEQVFEVAC